MERSVLTWLVLLSNFSFLCAIEPITFTAAVVGAASMIYGYFDRSPCRLIECCNHYSISTDAKNISSLQNVLQRSVYGQHLMQDIVIRALRGHMKSNNPAKALVLSFHGTPGCGKSYVSEFIAQSLFQKGMYSKYVRKFVGGNDFPDKSKADLYKIKIQDEVRSTVASCERSLFIFEDVDKMPIGVLDGVKPFVDYHTSINNVDFRKSIFIFLSNTGASLINKISLKLWQAGKQREDIQLKEFEKSIREGSFNEEGGLQKSDTISSSLIDFYIPFLPLEEKHVIKCIHDSYKRLGYTSAPDDAVKEILQEMTFFPPEVELYSTTGCKRVAAKVSALVDGQIFQHL